MSEYSDMEKVQKAVDSLGEHFDTVLILCSRHSQGEEGGTVNLALGSGNWFARYGQAREWCIKAEERSRKMVQEEE